MEPTNRDETNGFEGNGILDLALQIPPTPKILKTQAPKENQKSKQVKNKQQGSAPQIHRDPEPKPQATNWEETPGRKAGLPG